MRLIKEALLVAAGREHPPAARHLEAWRKTVKAASWRHLVDVRRTYPDTDAVKVRSGRQVMVFNIRRNDNRLIVAAHFNHQIAYTLRFMTHAEYSKDLWKASL
ncbi:MAG: type II toxin-antitoxin system HigB family toxin [Limisphaerales bacterium]